jgi:type I restriction enzyme R subunit
MSFKEARARIKINKMLEEAGWRFFDSDKGKANILLENNVKITEKLLDEFGHDFEKTKNGFIDFLLLDKRGFPLLVLEAKAQDKNPLIGKEQARSYAKSQKCRFVILSNGDSHYLWDLELGNPKVITRFPSPDGITEFSSFQPKPSDLVKEKVEKDYIVLTQKRDYQDDPLWKNEQDRPQYIEDNKFRFLRPYQLKAVEAIKEAVAKGKNRFLFEMATGTGKTLLAAAVIKLFIRTSNARRVLFLVDRLELEEQAYKAFVQYLRNDLKTFIYKENRDDWRVGEIVVSTIQTFMSKNRYMREFSPEDFDFVISDETHRSIGGNSRSVFEYFNGYKLGLTATPKDYLKNLDTRTIMQDDPREMERRILLDTYKTFGCETGDPTFRYSLVDGVKDGFLINPIVVDARTDITTQLLSDQGYAVVTTNDKGEEEEKIFIQKDFERKFFSEKTNRLFCKTLLEKSFRDPISGEIGKTLVFCVSQAHAAKITQILNELADQMFPGKYQSNFALQVTSSVMGAQQFSINFTNNVLSDSANFLPNYKTSKTRVCVTVGMMTTGYDCPDILNLAMMRPIFSPSEFVQMKGRGTRKHNFTEEIIDKKSKLEIGEKQKEKFKLFDFFANCEYFEEKFKYDEVLYLLPMRTGGKIPGGGEKPTIDPFENKGEDHIKTMDEVTIGNEGMKIDRMYFTKFEEKIKADKLVMEKVKNGEWDQLLDYLEHNILNKPEEFFTLQKLQKSFQIDRTITMREIVEKVFGLIPYFKTRNELLDEEFDKFDSRYMPKEEYFDYAKTVFKAYVLDPEFRGMIDEGNFALLNINPSGEAFQRLTPELRKVIPEYIKVYVPIEKFAA